LIVFGSSVSSVIVLLFIRIVCVAINSLLFFLIIVEVLTVVILIIVAGLHLSTERMDAGSYHFVYILISRTMMTIRIVLYIVCGYDYSVFICTLLFLRLSVRTLIAVPTYGSVLLLASLSLKLG